MKSDYDLFTGVRMKPAAHKFGSADDIGLFCRLAVELILRQIFTPTFVAETS